MEVQRIEIEPLLTLLVKKNPDNQTYLFKVENKSENVVKFKLTLPVLVDLKGKNKKKVTVDGHKVKKLIKAKITGPAPRFEHVVKYKRLLDTTRIPTAINDDLRLMITTDPQAGKVSFELENAGETGYNCTFEFTTLSNMTTKDGLSKWVVKVKPRSTAFIVPTSVTGEYQYEYRYEYVPFVKQKKVRLHYFNVRNRAEFIRWMLASKKVDFEDVRIGMADWPRVKSTFEFGQVPVLEIDGESFVTAIAIGRYLAMKYKMYPTGYDRVYEVESLVDYIVDIAHTYDVKFFLEHNPQAWDEWLKTEGIQRLRLVQSKLMANKGGKGPFVGSSLTLLDFVVAAFLHTHFFLEGQQERLAILARELPHLKGFVEYFLNESKRVVKYLRTRPPLDA
jgi:glutathione S-transferase